MMHSFKQSLLSVLSLSIVLLCDNVAALDPLFSSCSTSNNYTSSDPFANNLNQLGFQLVTSAPCTGFALGSVGQGSNRVNGLALCRGDVNSTSCKACVLTAVDQIYHLCPFKKEAIISFDECLLRYSDATFSGEIDNQHQILLVNTQNVSSSFVEFNAQVLQMMNSLKVEACNSPTLFASEVMEVGAPEKLYGLAQCTRDLSVDDCKACLENAIDELPGCCGGRRGGRVVGGSCNVGYELYPFFNV